MQVKVNVDLIGQSIDEHIESQLKLAGFPTCLGSMVPPIISRQVDFSDVEILIAKEAVSEKEVAVSDVSKLIDSDVAYYRGKVMKQSGVDHIEKYKSDRAGKYAEQVIKCCNCTFTEVCNKLTENYLKILSIQEGMKLQEILKSKKEV